MNQENNKFDIEKFDTALANTPEEVRAFLWSDAYKKLLEAIQKKFSLSDEQNKLVDEIIFGSLTETESEENIEQSVLKLELSEQKRNELLSYIFTYFIEPSINKTEEIFETEKKEDIYPESVIDAPNPVQALNTIKERLSQTSTIAPIKRNYSEESPQPIKEDTTKERIIDPYRELPEK